MGRLLCVLLLLMYFCFLSFSFLLHIGLFFSSLFLFQLLFVLFLLSLLFLVLLLLLLCFMLFSIWTSIVTCEPFHLDGLNSLPAQGTRKLPLVPVFLWQAGEGVFVSLPAIAKDDSWPMWVKRSAGPLIFSAIVLTSYLCHSLKTCKSLNTWDIAVLQ